MSINHCVSCFIMILFSYMTLVSCSSTMEQSSLEDEKSLTETTIFRTETDIPDTQLNASTEVSEEENPALYLSVEDVGLYEVDGQPQTYAFLYDGETYQAVYTPDNWKIIDSYKIKNADDIEMICQALSDVHPIHGADMESYRTAEDMAYEWIQHNLAYQLLSDDSLWKQNAKDVDINPADQGKSIYDFYKERISSDAEDS